MYRFFKDQQPVNDSARILNRELRSLIDYESRHSASSVGFSSFITKLNASGVELLTYEVKDLKYKIAAITVFDCLLDVVDELVPERRMDIISHPLRKILENDKVPLETSAPVLRLAALVIGHFARIGSTLEIEFLQNTYWPIVLRLLGDTKSPCHKFAGSLLVTQLSLNAPALIFASRKQLFTNIWDVVSDRSKLVRAAAAESLEVSLQLVSQRSYGAMDGYIKTGLMQIETGLAANISEKIIGSLLILKIIVVSTNELQEKLLLDGAQICKLMWIVLSKKDNRDDDVKNQVLTTLPYLARAFSVEFIEQNKYTKPLNFLEYIVKFLLDTIKSSKYDNNFASKAYVTLGKLLSIMASYYNNYNINSNIVEKSDEQLGNPSISNLVDEIFSTIRKGLIERYCGEALQSFGVLLNLSSYSRSLLDRDIINDMFGGGITSELMDILKIIMRHVLSVRGHIQNKLLSHITYILHLNINNGNDETYGKVNNDLPLSSRRSSISNTFFSVFSSQSSSSTFQTSLNKDAQTILALKALACKDFYPKQILDRSLLTAEEFEAVVEEIDQTHLVKVVRDYVIRFLADSNVNVREEAAKTCIAVLDVVVMRIKYDSEDYYYMCQIIDRLLIFGIGDDSDVIRCNVFLNFTPSLDHIISQSDNVHCIIESLDDENLNVRKAGMALLSRVAHYDTLHIMPVVMLNLKILLRQLQGSNDVKLKHGSVQVLQAMVSGIGLLIQPFVKQILKVLMNLLSEKSSEIVSSSLSTISELAITCPEHVREHLDELFTHLINALYDETSMNKKEIAVIAIGKLVSSLTLVTEETYLKYPGLFEGLMQAIKTVGEGSTELRIQVIKTVGLLGVVKSDQYQKHLLKRDILPVEDVKDEYEEDVADFDKDNKLSKREMYYLSIVTKGLMDIIRDLSLSTHHHTASAALIKVVRLSGPQSLPLLSQLLDCIINRLYLTEFGNNLRVYLLDHIISLIQIVGKQIRNYQDKIVKLVCDFFDFHLQQCLDIIESLCVVIPLQDFNLVLRNVLPFLLNYIKDEPFDINADVEQVVESSNLPATNTSQSIKTASEKQKTTSFKMNTKNTLPKTKKILKTISTVSCSLGEYRRDLIPIVIVVMNDENASIEIRKYALTTLMLLRQDSDICDFANIIVHPLLRLLSSNEPQLQIIAIVSLSTMACSLVSGFIPYIVPVKRKLKSIPLFSNPTTKPPQVDEYESLIYRLLKQRHLPNLPVYYDDIISISVENRLQREFSEVNNNDMQVNIQALETAWALAGRNSANDLVEWMRRLSIELIRQSPSPIIRACDSLAKVYKPLADHLFNASFSCIWDELYVTDSNDITEEIPLITGIELALQSKNVPPEIVSSLLNLAEFMDMQDTPLPLDVQLLARGAAEANMFGKCLRYRELEFISPNVISSNECIESLISVNNELGLPDRAEGVLTVTTKNSNIEIQPLWLEKLKNFEAAKDLYLIQNTKFRNESIPYESPSKNILWMESELGSLRCLHALGEFDELEETAKKLKEQISMKDHVKKYDSWMGEIQKLGSNSAWMLGKWDSMQEFLDIDVGTEQQHSIVCDVIDNSSFYKAVLAIRKHDFSNALVLIANTRLHLSNIVNSLLSESYSRAYHAMISMQILSEMEEVVEYKQLVLKAATDLETKRRNGDSPISQNVSIMNYKKEDIAPSNSDGIIDLQLLKSSLLRKWHSRLKFAPEDISVYRQILAVRSLIAKPTEDLDSWLNLVALCRREGMFTLCSNMLKRLGAPLILTESTTNIGTFTIVNTYNKDPDSFIFPTVNFRVIFETFKFWWNSGQNNHALNSLQKFIKTLDNTRTGENWTALDNDFSMFKVNCLLKCANWMRQLEDHPLSEVLSTVLKAKEIAADDYNVWHALAVANYDYLGVNKDVSNDIILSDSNSIVHDHTTNEDRNSFNRSDNGSNNSRRASVFSNENSNIRRSSVYSLAQLVPISYISTNIDDPLIPYVINSIKGFARSIILGQGQNNVATILQDTLRLLTLWFTYGAKAGVGQILKNELDQISPDNWLSVIPQLIARMNLKTFEIAVLLKKLLIKLAAIHPQALVCPISVALNTEDKQQKIVATEVLSEIRKRRSQLVDEATMVSRELMTVALTPHEFWNDGLEKAASQYIEFKDIDAMIRILVDLHEAMNDGLDRNTSSKSFDSKGNKEEGFSDGIGKIGRTSLRDISFRNSYERQLQEAQDWLNLFIKSGRTTDLHQSWEIYQQVFKKIKLQLSNFKKAKVELSHVSNALTNALDLQLAVPGTYNPPADIIRISSFVHCVTVIPSKQRPRRMSIVGSDGKIYQFLLKGNEDLRLDERVMHLFGLINVCLENNRSTGNRGLEIVRYSVMPLSNNSGLIGWVENCDTINSLIVQYRESNNIPQGIEQRLVLSKAPALSANKRNRPELAWDSYYKLPLMNKVDIFQQILDETTGQDLSKMLWLKSKSADVWVSRRANFTKSLAVSSIFILFLFY